MKLTHQATDCSRFAPSHSEDSSDCSRCNELAEESNDDNANSPSPHLTGVEQGQVRLESTVERRITVELSDTVKDEDSEIDLRKSEVDWEEENRNEIFNLLGQR
jgi:hypothetical protein